MAVVTTLKVMCTMEICMRILSGAAILIQLIKGVKRLMQINRVAPMMLNSRCTVAVRFAVRLVPIQESTAVTQVPMF